MRVKASVPSRALAEENPAVPEALVEAVIRGVTQAFYGHLPRQSGPAEAEDCRPDLPALLAPRQVADLLGISRNTVDRMAEDGELPSVVMREGSRQRMIRIPKAFVLQMLRDLNKGARISLRDYAASWSASVTGQPPVPGAPVYAVEVA
jgi:excisionase family DNA binding protein